MGKEEDSGICITCMQARFQAKIKFSFAGGGKVCLTLRLFSVSEVIAIKMT